IGTFSTLMLSFTRLPMVMADEGYLPNVFARKNARTGAPWVAIGACAMFWTVCYPLGFEKNLILDVLITGLSILLEFCALVVLRVREPDLPRPFRVPGGIAGTVAISLPPLALMVAVFARNRQELVGDTNGLILGTGIVFAGAALYFLSAALRGKRQS
ncbi:MAG: amino acid permease, partial [Bryobacteraceae bacterium]